MHFKGGKKEGKERGQKKLIKKRGLQVCCHAQVSGFYFVGQKGEKDRKIPSSPPPSLLLKSAPCALFELVPSVEEKSRIRGDI